MNVNLKGLSLDSKPRRDGRWQARITIDGVQKSVYGKTQEEAKNKIIALSQYIKKPEKSIFTFSQWLDKWLELYKIHKLRANTLKSYTNCINKYLKPKLGKIKISKLSALELQATINSITAKRQREICTNLIWASLDKAYKTGLIKKNPALAIERHKTDYTERRALTIDEQNNLLNATKNNKFYLLINIYLYTGCRRSEALGLKWENIDLKSETIFIEQQKGMKGSLEPLKTKKSKRLIPILKPLKDILQNIKFGNPKELIFSWSPDFITRELRKIFNSLNMLDVDVHCLRHTYQTRLKEWNIPADLRQKWLGHSKAETTQRYDHVLPEYEKSQIDKLKNLFDTKFDTKKDENN